MVYWGMSEIYMPDGGSEVADIDAKSAGEKYPTVMTFFHHAT